MSLPNAHPKPQTRYQAKVEKAKTLAAHERDVWVAVDIRDGCACRVCGQFCRSRAIGTLNRPHRHHLIYRSAGGATSTENVILLCAACHDAEHRHELRLSGNADERDEMGRLAGVTVERRTEAGWIVEKLC